MSENIGIILDKQKRLVYNYNYEASREY